MLPDFAVGIAAIGIGIGVIGSSGRRVIGRDGAVVLPDCEEDIAPVGVDFGGSPLSRMASSKSASACHISLVEMGAGPEVVRWEQLGVQPRGGVVGRDCLVIFAGREMLVALVHVAGRRVLRAGDPHGQQPRAASAVRAPAAWRQRPGRQRSGRQPPCAGACRWAYSSSINGTEPYLRRRCGRGTQRLRPRDALDHDSQS